MGAAWGSNQWLWLKNEHVCPSPWPEKPVSVGTSATDHAALMRVLDFASPPLTASPLLQVWEMKKARDFTEADFFLNALVFGLFQRPQKQSTQRASQKEACQLEFEQKLKKAVTINMSE